MKSLFANKEIILPSWLKILMETIDSETIQKLSENQEYRKMQIRRKELLEHYPIIEKVIDDEGKVSIQIMIQTFFIFHTILTRKYSKSALCSCSGYG